MWAAACLIGSTTVGRLHALGCLAASAAPQPTLARLERGRTEDYSLRVGNSNDLNQATDEQNDNCIEINT